MGGTVAATCAAWEEYARRHESLLPAFPNESNKHLCWAGKHSIILCYVFLTGLNALNLLHSARSRGDPSCVQGLWRGILHILR